MEMLLFVWTAGLLVDEANQYLANPRTFQLDLWNRFDYVMLSITTGALSLRIIGLEAKPSWYEFDHEWLQHMLLAVNNLLVWCRLLQYYSSSKSIGVLIIMVIQMTQDVFIWVLLSVVFMFAFQVSFFSIATAENMNDVLEVPIWYLSSPTSSNPYVSRLHVSALPGPPAHRTALASAFQSVLGCDCDLVLSGPSSESLIRSKCKNGHPRQGRSCCGCT